MQAALKLSDSGKPSYYLSNGTDGLRTILEVLEIAHPDGYFLFIERISRVDRQIRRCLYDNVLRCGTIVAAERESVWHNQSSELLLEFNPTELTIHGITEKDADEVIRKLEKYASSNVGLLQLGARERRKLLLEKARRQLLIGLLEATYGVGYKRLIVLEYEGLASEGRIFVSVVGLATYFDLSLPKRVVDLIFRERMPEVSTSAILSTLKGVVRLDGAQLYARHPVYIREIFRSLSSKDEAERALTWLCEYFSSLPKPISRYRNELGRNLVELFKKIINHAFVSFLLQTPERVMAFYKKFERSFQSDGLYWLQMGLAYRSVGKHDEALQALETGLLLHPITHTRHALGRQKLINAAEKLNSGEREKAISSMDDGIRCLKELDNLDELVGGATTQSLPSVRGTYFCQS